MTPVELDDIPSADETPRPLLLFEHLFLPPAAVAPSTSSSHPSSTDAPPPATLPPAAEPGGLQDQFEPPKDEQGPRFKDQVHPGLVEPDTAEAIEEGKEEEEDLQEEHVGIPIASALLVTDTRIELEDRVQQLDLERQQHELERQHRQHLEEQLDQLQSKKRWIRGVIVAAVGLVVGVAAFLSICGTSGNCRRSNTTGTSPASTQSRSVSEKRSITAFINNITLSNQTLRYPSNATAEERALLWLINVDLSTTESNTSSLRQRYALATIWFQTPTGFGDADVAATWTSDITECAWQWVDCDDAGRLVTSLYLSLGGVEGRIPADLGLLTALTDLDLRNNELNGTIPSSLASLTDLNYLDLSLNGLSGTIPSTVASLTALTSLGLGLNALKGTIPSSLSSLTALTELYLYGNSLNGTIPSSIASLTALTILDLSLNGLSGAIPSSIASLTALTGLSLWGNVMTGTILSSIGSLLALTSLDLSRNALNGTVPSSIASLTALTYLDLRDNALTGTIPTTITALTDLNYFYVFNNSLTGTIPFCNSVSNQSFDALVADCDKVSCPCCTHCCPTSQGGISVYGHCFVYS